MLGCPCRIPRQQRYVSRDRYVVQPGDDVATIARKFGIPGRRYGELVGANLHKSLDDAPYGYKQRVFRDLTVGEQLSVPSTWAAGTVRGPLVVGSSKLQVGAKPSIDRLKLFTDVILSTPIPATVLNYLSTAGISLPAGATIEDVIAVIFSWWPYVDWPGGTVPDLPTPTNPNLPNTATLVTLMKQAVEFLRATGITDGTSTQVQNVPWDVVLWNSVPWDQVGPVMGDLSSVMASLPMPTYATATSITANQSPNFLTDSWKDQDWIKVLGDIEWSDSLTELLSDEEAVACTKANPDRLKALLDCTYCYSDVQQLKTILCSSTPADPCQCKEVEPEDTNGETKSEDNTALIAGAVVVGGLAIAVTAFMLSGRK
jgi:hypothetical protein